MKYAANLLLVIIFTAISFPCQSQNINPERMNRDLNITKNILQEMFKTTNGGGLLRVSSGSFSFGSHMDISGTYLQDYGVIFSIPGRRSVYIFASDDDKETTELSFAYGGDDNGKEVSEASITNRMKEFLREYGSTIGQLDNDERITLIYGNDNTGHAPIVRAFTTSGKNVKSSSGDIAPIITATARKSDLEAYSRGSVSAAAFDSRVKITKSDANETRQDLKIMSNILKTSFENAGSNAYHVRGNVNSSYIDDLGALFYLDAGFGSTFFELSSAVVKMREEIKRIDRDSTTIWTSRTPAADRKSAVSDKERAEAYNSFLQQLKETLVDYGRTLKSVQADEQVYVSASLSNAGGEVPGRVDLQIKKSVLESLDRGNMSRDQAIAQVKIREY